MFQKKSPAIVWFVVLLLVGAGLALALPANMATLHALGINEVTYRLSILSLIVPYGVIWFAAFYAYAKLEQYARKLENTREGEAFKKIADGVRFLAWGLALSTILSILFRGIESWTPGFHAAHIIIDNYIGLLVPLISFTMIGNGTRLLAEIVRLRPSSAGVRMLGVVFSVIGVTFSYFVILNQGNTRNAYYLPPIVLLMTIVVPYMFAWLVGSVGAYELRLYARKTRGLLYQRALVWLASGLITVVGGSIIVQYLDVIFAGRSGLSLGIVLAIIYALLAIQTVGYACIAFGANKLKKIEEV